MRKRVLLAAPRSFCAGVDRAIEIVERLLAEHGPPIYVRHQIVHNDHVVHRLERMGAVFVDSEDEVPPGEICVLSAHGVAPGVRENCERRGLRVVDAVCPLVSKVHAEARRYADSGHLVALVGHADHVEVIGTRGERPDATVVVESPEGAAQLDSGGKPVAEEATLILVIGSETSSNAQRLVEVARLAGAEAELIDGESELPSQLLDGHEVIGLTAGASTPGELVDATIRELAARGYQDV